MNGWRVALAVRSVTVHPDDVSRRLGLSPDRTSSRPEQRWPYIWELASDRPPDADLDDHLAAVAGRCAAALTAIAELAATEGVTVAVEAVFRGAEAPGIWIPPAAIAFAAACGIGVDVDLLS
ncbi:hypothetical protein BJ973_005681 [Actinoplanes tereljensis]|uniref:DUF4279 domain-containing protein n=1 Tax=Paractinoplanes tereljensis TaxID=571912 RepID=A0A919NZU4_9ACTN|nr:DUF4279 domain-containing protein [Actinoplanes tereljensis]GIF26322.1 hypothetical protein Ate02nite_90520 [Actinoplanes tereljensis]